MTSNQINPLKDLFDRSLNNLIKELDLFQNSKDLWVAPKDINNSAGNLILHLCGNLQHFVGSVLGKTGYVRQRDQEFSLRDVPVKELREQIIMTKEVVASALSGLSQESLEDTYPIELQGRHWTTGSLLIHLHSHLNYHLGQINYLRRML